MKPRTISGALLGASLAIAVIANVSAADKEKPTVEVEARVTQTIRNTFPDVVISSMAKENEDGLDVIGVAFTSKGKKMDADVTPDGILVGTEEEADIKAFPKAAAKALKKATKGMKASYEIARTFAKGEKDGAGVTKVMKLAEPTIAYEADVEKDGKKGEFAFDANGKLLESPSWAKSGSEEKEEKEEKGKDKD